MSTPGRLFLVPTPLDFACTELAPLHLALPMGTIEQASRLQHWIGENAKSTRQFLGRVNAIAPLCCPLQDMSIATLPRASHKKGDHQHEASQDAAMRALLAPAVQGHDMGLVSEAGMPAIADPGSSVVRAAHTLGLAVKPLVGPVSLMLALAASGLNGQNFAFVGYLPIASDERKQRIAQLQQLAQQSGQTQMVIETPYRNAALLAALVAQLAPTTRLAILLGATLAAECAYSARVADWRQKPPLLDLSLPAVFVWGPG